jgi:hypothetical protein
MTKWLAFGGIALGISLIGYAVFARETDEEKILGVLGRIERVVRVDADTATNPLIRASQLKREYSEIFDKNVTYRIPDLSIPASGGESVESLVRLTVQSSVALTTLDVSFSKTDIHLATPPSSATVKTVAKVRAFHGSSPYEEGNRDVRFEFSRNGGDWRITSFNVGSIRD